MPAKKGVSCIFIKLLTGMKIIVIQRVLVGLEDAFLKPGLDGLFFIYCQN